MQPAIDKKHGKLYANRPKVLTIACENCGKKYIKEFTNPNDDMTWQKELKETKCIYCHFPRI